MFEFFLKADDRKGTFLEHNIFLPSLCPQFRHQEDRKSKNSKRRKHNKKEKCFPKLTEHKASVLMYFYLR